MIFCLLFFYLLGGSAASDNATTGTGCSFSPKSIMCVYKGNMKYSSSDLVDLDPKDIPPECEVIIYGRFQINTLAMIDVDEVLLKSVTDLHKTVIVNIFRDNGYEDWVGILGPEGNPKETKVLCDFAIRTKISGFLVKQMAPRDPDEGLNPNVGKYIIPYIKQLKCSPEFIIGVAVETVESSIKNPNVYNFQEMNDLVDFYEIRTNALNDCKPTEYNGRTPITKADPKSGTVVMEDVASFLNESKILHTKKCYVMELIPIDLCLDNYYFSSYAQVCTGQFNSSSWCIQNTKNLYDKGKFALEQGSGIMINIIDLDDVNNDCGCSTPFAGFQNIIAGFRGGSQTPCKKFDVQSTPDSFQ